MESGRLGQRKKIQIETYLGASSMKTLRKWKNTMQGKKMFINNCSDRSMEV